MASQWSGASSVVIDDPGWGAAAVAPDGKSLVQLRDLGQDGPELVVKDLVSGAEEQLGTHMVSFNQQIYWSADSRWLLMSYNDPAIQAQGSQSLLIWDMQTRRLAHQLPIPDGWQLVLSSSQWPQFHLTGERVVAFVEGAEGRHLITAHLGPRVTKTVGYRKLSPSDMLIYSP